MYLSEMMRFVVFAVAGCLVHRKCVLEKHTTYAKLSNLQLASQLPIT